MTSLKVANQISTNFVAIQELTFLMLETEYSGFEGQY